MVATDLRLTKQSRELTEGEPMYTLNSTSEGESRKQVTGENKIASREGKTISNNELTTILKTLPVDVPRFEGHNIDN